jgi:hypothetical protein
LIYPYGKDYIQYLNDEGYSRITYEQWKNKISKQELGKGKNGKDQIHSGPKYK